jgi:hypothetical protein
MTWIVIVSSVCCFAALLSREMDNLAFHRSIAMILLFFNPSVDGELQEKICLNFVKIG